MRSFESLHPPESLAGDDKTVEVFSSRNRKGNNNSPFSHKTCTKEKKKKKEKKIQTKPIVAVEMEAHSIGRSYCSR